ncbi:MAG: hypothetical protein CL917_09185 [Deltaproteobacteria bacterium]|nr:hypothetical protein [Deltaproteobacteria bacterium]
MALVPIEPMYRSMLDFHSRLGGLVGNRRIADALIGVLTEDGQSSTRSRVLRALGEDAAMLERPDPWIPVESLRTMLAAAHFDRGRARRLGEALVRPSVLSIALCYSGLASPSKVYRRVDQLLARESRCGFYEPIQVGEQSACIRYSSGHEGPDETEVLSAADWSECGELLCGMRQGMLAMLPSLFGLRPADVVETACVHNGDPCCEFSVQWARSRRRGLWMGTGIGLSAGAVAAALGLPGVLVMLGFPLLGAALGRSVDLSLQLEAVAGVSRGQLALLEQLDSGLSDRMDALAQLQGDQEVSRALPSASSFDQGEGLVPASIQREVSPVSVGETTGVVREGAAEVYSSSSDLRDDLAALRTEWVSLDRSELMVRLERCEEYGRQIGEAASEIDRAVGGGLIRRKSDLRALVERAISRLQRDHSNGLEFEVDVAGALPPVHCDPLQIEIVVEQLLQNAAKANGHVGRVSLSLRPHADGVEVAVLDQGQGIEADLLDEVFDPFVSEADENGPGGLGLPVCFRIVEEHGGELRFQTGDSGGARVAFVLPVE